MAGLSSQRWIAIDESGTVVGASVAEYTEPRLLREWKERGEKVELVLAKHITIGAPLPTDADVVRIVR